MTTVKAAVPVVDSSPIARPKVILLESVRAKSGTGKKKKIRYSFGLGTIQHLERGATRGLETTSKGAARTFTEYSDRSDKSARRKRDGAIKDGIENWTKAISKGMRIAGDAPYDFFRQLGRGPGSKQVRDTVRLLMPPPLR
jgi:hypothetical protein